MKEKVKKEKKKIVKAVAKTLNKGMGGRYLLKFDPYFQTLMDPFNVHGVRIPDFEATPSAPFTLVKRVTLTSNANGVAGCVFGFQSQTSASAQGSLVPLGVTNVNTAVSGAIGMSLSTTATSADLTLGTSSVITFDQFNWTGNGTTLIPSTVQGIFRKARLVSFGAVIQYLGSPLNAQGKITVAAAPRITLRNDWGLGGIGVDRVGQLPGAKIVPINELHGAACVYKPQDPVSLSYNSLDVGTQPTVNPGIQAWSAQYASYMGGELYLIADGMTASTPTLLVTVIGNYEGIPHQNQLMIQEASPSPVDPISMAQTFNAVQSAPATFGSDKAVEAAFSPKGPLKDVSIPGNGGAIKLQPASKAQERSFLDKIVSGLEGVGKVAEKVADVGTKVAPLAAEALALLA